MWPFLLLLCMLLIIYVWIYRPLTYWKRHGIPSVTPVPLFGNIMKSALQLRPLKEDVLDMYNAHPEMKCTGVYFFNKPNLLIRDPELLKSITIKDFDHFLDHSKQFFREDLDPLLGKNLFGLSGTKWRKMRATLSPTFTGSKMKGMFNLISECGSQIVNYVKKEIEKQEDGILKLEMKDLFSRFSNDVIATSAFGIKCDSLVEKNNEFYTMGKKVTEFKAWRFFGINAVPFLMKIFNQGIVPKCVYTFFTELVLETLSVRKKQGIIRPDMIHLLMEAQKGSLKHEESVDGEQSGFSAVEESHIGKSNEKIVLSDDDIIAQAFIFFIAGFDPSSGAMCFATHELAVNPDIQKRLQEEIDEILGETKEKLTYEQIHKMKYLDMVVSETLRKWSLAPNTDRLCTKSFKFTENDGTEITIEKGMTIMIPVIAFHFDPKYFPNPDKFDPDRFSDENKNNITPLTYMPFGVGPRNCIGSRFALMEIKIGIVLILSHFDIVVTQNTQIPLKLMATATRMIAEKGFHLGLKLRN